MLRATYSNDSVLEVMLRMSAVTATIFDGRRWTNGRQMKEEKLKDSEFRVSKLLLLAASYIRTHHPTQVQCPPRSNL